MPFFFLFPLTLMDLLNSSPGPQRGCPPWVCVGTQHSVLSSSLTLCSGRTGRTQSLILRAFLKTIKHVKVHFLWVRLLAFNTVIMIFAEIFKCLALNLKWQYPIEIHILCFMKITILRRQKWKGCEGLHCVTSLKSFYAWLLEEAGCLSL